MVLRRKSIIASFAFAAAFAIGGGQASAHCDGLDGPVVTAARHALEDRAVDQVLIWVREEDEAEIRAAFDQTLAVRALGAQAQALADRYFFETLVRIHRAGEGAPYTGLKPAGRDLGPAIPSADDAVDVGSLEAIEQLLTNSVQSGLRAHFERVMERRGFAASDVGAGRAYVEAYVTYIHYVERLHEAASREPLGHYPEEH